MIVTDKKYFMEKRLLEKLDLMIKRVHQKKPKLDCLLNVEGEEGTGKTTLAVSIAYYIADQTGRSFDESNIFFDVEKLIKFAQSTEDKIIIWDEPALDGLSSEWWKESQKNLIKLLMTARKKRHFYIFCLTKFHKFNEYMVVDRPMAMIHTYYRRRVEPGRFVYIKKKYLEGLLRIYKTKKVRAYKKFTAFHGSFVDALSKIIDEVAYDKEKDKAIMSIGNQKKDAATIDKQKLNKFLYSLSQIKLPIESKEDLADKLKVNRRTLYRWAEKYAKYAPVP